jgi:hypothetical protein
VSPSNRLEVQLRALKARPDVSLVAGPVERFRSADKTILDVITPPPQPRLEWELLFGNAFGTGAHFMFPRTIDGQPVLFPASRRYAEDYALGCRLCRLGSVNSPTEIVYRYRQHPNSISGLHKSAQEKCASEIRHETQARFLDSEKSFDRSRDVSRFWRCDGDQRFEGRVRDAIETLAELRGGFLLQIEQRYGTETRAALEAHIDVQPDERLAYWLYWAATRLDARSCGGLLVAAMRRRALRIGLETFKLGAGGLYRRLARAALDS